MVAALISTSPVERGLTALLAVNVVVALRRQDSRLRPLLWAMAISSGLAMLLSGLLSHSGAHVLVRIPHALPLVGGPVTLEALVYGLDSGLGIAAAVLVIAPLSQVLRPQEIVDAMPAALQRTAALIGAALNLVPGMGRSAIAIAEAQRMRGDGRGGLRLWRQVAVPVVLSALEDSLTLAEAMESRGFGSRRRTRYSAGGSTAGDVVVLGASLVAALLLVASRLLGSLPDWYPYPALGAPEVALLPLLALALLTAPLLAWRTSSTSPR